ncbi:MAG TPA: nucleotidyl transferase AbiEii/AbiGii toxin family protein [Puia sp.]|nr:nucleotidyl transferase AbiEii/AbiGii toxin family protein [Puia sp.]
MLHTETVEPGTLDLATRLSQDAALKNFVLVGGTALSLQLGHRKSIDLDFFSTIPFDVRQTARHLTDRHNASGMVASQNTLHLDIGDVRTSFLSHQYPLVAPVNESDGIRMASLEDIGAMKLNAIVNNGQRVKDYVDVHFLLAQKNLDQLLNAYTEKYPEANSAIAKRALLYHKEIDFNANVDLTGGDLKWVEIVKRLKAAVTHPGRVFNEIKMTRKR